MIFPTKAPSAEELAAAASRDGFDGVMATHFVGASQRNYWMPDYAGVGFGWRWRYYDYWDAVYGPGYVETEHRRTTRPMSSRSMPAAAGSSGPASPAASI